MDEVAGPAPDPQTTTTTLNADLLPWRQLDALCSNGHAGIVFDFALGTLVLGFLPPDAEFRIWLGWFAALTVGGLSKAAFLAACRRRATAATARRWSAGFASVAGSQGLIWGTLAFLPAADHGATGTAIVLLALAAACGNALVTLGWQRIACWSFIVFAVLPCGLAQVAGPAPGGALLGGAVLLYGLFIAACVWLLDRTWTRALRTQLKRTARMEKLEVDVRTCESMNRRLGADIAARQQIEMELRAAKELAEMKADQLSLNSSLDSLTGLAAPRHYEDALKREWARGLREGTPLALLFCRLDAARAYRDRNGTKRAEESLRLVAHVLRMHARRANDLAARVDEQTFALLMPLTETAPATRVADQMRDAVLNLRLEHGASPVGPFVTVSLGVVSLIPQPGMSFKILPETAANMVESVQADGGNRVRTYSPFQA